MKKSKSTVLTRFNLLVLLQILLIACTPVIILWIRTNPFMNHTPIILGGIWATQILLLFWFLINRERRILEAIRLLKHETGYHNLERLFKYQFNPQMAIELKSLVEAFRNVRIGREKDLSFFSMVMQYLPIGVMVYSKSGKVHWTNREIEQLLGVQEHQNILTSTNSNSGVSSLLKSLNQANSTTSRVHLDGETRYLFSRCSTFRMEEVDYFVVSVQDIKEEVYRLENDTLQRMLRVLSHEIVNSLNPISFLSYGMLNDLENNDQQVKIDQNIREKFISGLKTIRKRSEGLTGFINAYNQLIHFPEPIMSSVKLPFLMNQLQSLFKQEFETANIEFTSSGNGESDEIISDENLIIQVLINLINNAIQALEETVDPHIHLRWKTQENKAFIDVIDNGRGIPDKHLIDIFATFFTTREKGSGLGLAFSKQVIERLGGDISVNSVQGSTCFTLRIPVTMENPT